MQVWETQTNRVDGGVCNAASSHLIEEGAQWAHCKTILHGPALMSPVILAGTEIVYGKFADVMLHRQDVVGHITRMANLARPPPTSTQSHTVSSSSSSSSPSHLIATYHYAHPLFIICLFHDITYLWTSCSACQFSGPWIWNSLPLCIRKSKSLRAVKRHLNTHLFQLAYPAP